MTMRSDRYIIDGHKLFWHLDRVTEWQSGRLTAPIYVEVSPLSLCNHNCIFCGIDFARDTKSRLDTEIFKKRIAEMGKLGVRSIMFAGEGEPLLHKDIKTFVSTARDSGMDVSLTTNGSMGNYGVWKDLLPHLTWVRFSVDASSPEVYARVHKVSEDAFGTTIKSIEDAVKVKRDRDLDVTIGVQYLIVDENLDNIEGALPLFSKIGVDYLSLKPYSLHPQMAAKKSVAYDKKILCRIENMVDKFRPKTAMKIIMRKDAMEKYIGNEKKFSHCRALPFWGYISSRGDFYTCSVFIGDERFKAGNIHDQDMKSIIFGQPRKDSISYGAEKLKIDKECRLNCRMARVNEFLEFLKNKPEHINFI